MSQFNQGFQPQNNFGGPQGFQGQPQGNFNGGGQQNGNGGGNKSAYSNHAKIQLIGNLTKDPVSEPVGNAKVGKSAIAINHKGQKGDTDFWNIELWANQGGSSAQHDFFVDNCKSGRQVFVEGTPYVTINKDAQGNIKIFPTVRVTNLVALGAPTNGGGQQQQQQGGGFQQQQQPQGGGFQQQQQQGGFQQPQGNFGGAPQGQFGAPQQQYGAPQGQFAGAGTR
jgi:single-strand DNA-binding protein